MMKFILGLILVQQCCVIMAEVEFSWHQRYQSTKLSAKALPPDYDHNKPTYLLLHGMGGSNEDGCIKNLIRALLSRQDANIIVPNYYQSAFYYTILYQQVAKEIANFLKVNNVDPRRMTVMGHSLGSHIGGVLANEGVKPKGIIGMDPAGPQFSVFPDAWKLSPQSADFVQAVHTNAGQLGSSSLDGDLDIYINRGTDFPCCSSMTCRHTGACDWTASTIRSGPVPANICPSQANARSGTCSNNSSSVLIGFGAPSVKRRTVAHLELSECVQRL